MKTSRVSITLPRPRKPIARRDNGQARAPQGQVRLEPRTVPEFIRAIKLALAEGAYLSARELSAEGARRFPEHILLAKYARVLAPPRVIRRQPATKTDIRVNRDWLKQHGDQYRGKWIALRDGELRGVADSLQALFDALGTRDVFVTKVF